MLVRFGLASAMRRGSALLGALFVVLSVSVLSVAYLQLSLSKNREGKSAIDAKRAFYLAESGLAEAFASIEMGRSGNVGSPDEPARFATGVFWVAAEPLDASKTLLRSTGLAGGARTTLSLVVDRTSISIPAQGAYGIDGVVVREGAVVDAYDSRVGTYAEQAWDPERYAQLTEEESAVGAGTAEEPGAGTAVGGGSYYLRQTAGGGLLGGTTTTVAGLIPVTQVSSYTLAELVEIGGEVEDPSALPRAGRIVSNGDVQLFGPTSETERATTVFGDVRPGPTGSVIATSRVLISGETTPNLEAIPLPVVPVPVIEDLGDRSVAAGATFLVPGEQAAYGTLRATAGSTLRLRGPLELVVGELVVDPGATLQVDTEDGPVHVWVTEYLGLEEDANLSFASHQTERALFIVTASEWVDRDGDGTDDSPATLAADGQFRGVLYAPNADLVLDAELGFFGSLAARHLTLLPSARYHFDMALTDAILPGLCTPRILAWRFEPVPDVELTHSRLDPLIKLALMGITPLHPEDARRDTLLTMTFLCMDGHTHAYRGLKSRFLHQAAVSTVLFSSETVLTAADGALAEESNYDDYDASLFGHFIDSGFIRFP